MTTKISLAFFATITFIAFLFTSRGELWNVNQLSDDSNTSQIAANSTNPAISTSAPNNESDLHEVLKLLDRATPLVHHASVLLPALWQRMDEIHAEADCVDQVAHDLEKQANNRSQLESLKHHTLSLYAMATESEPALLETHNITILDGEQRASIWIDFAKSLSYSTRFLETAIVKQVDVTHQSFRAISDHIKNLTLLVKRLEERVPAFNQTTTPVMPI